MKLIDIVTVDKFISGLDLSKFDSQTRIAILKNHITMKAYVDKFEQDVNSIKNGLVKGHEEKIQELSSARAKGMSENDIQKQFPDILSLERDLNTMVNDLANKEQGIEVFTVDTGKFLDGLVACEKSLTAEDLTVFFPLFTV